MDPTSINKNFRFSKGVKTGTNSWMMYNRSSIKIFLIFQNRNPEIEIRKLNDKDLMWCFLPSFKNNSDMNKADKRNIPAFLWINIKNDGIVDRNNHDCMPVLIYLLTNKTVKLNKHRNTSSDQTKTEIINIFVEQANKSMKRNW